MIVILSHITSHPHTPRLTLTIDFTLYIPKVFLSLGFLLIRSSCSRWLPFFIHYPKGEHSSCKKQQQITHSTRQEVFLAIVIVLREMSKRVSINLSIFLWLLLACVWLWWRRRSRVAAMWRWWFAVALYFLMFTAEFSFLCDGGRIVIVFISYHSDKRQQQQSHKTRERSEWARTIFIIFKWCIIISPSPKESYVGSDCQSGWASRRGESDGEQFNWHLVLQWRRRRWKSE